MSWFILLSGVAILLVNLFQWRTLNRSLTLSSLAQRRFPPFVYLRSLLEEWKSYAMSTRELKGMKGGLTALGAFLGLLIFNANWLEMNLLCFVPVTIATLFIIQIRIGRTAKRRNFEESFPEVLAVINAAVSAGNSIHQALHRCGQGIAGPLGETFRHIDRRLNVGEEPERVFSDACKTYPYKEFYFFIVVMLVSLQHGGQLKMLIGRLTRIITANRTMARRKLAMTSEARTSAKIVVAIPVLFFCGMKYFSPKDFDFVIHDPTGQLLLAYVAASEALGILIIWLLLKRAL